VKVVGIDPGTAACGWGIVHERDGRLRAVGHGWWQTRASERPELRLKTIFDGVGELIAEHEPDAVALEESFVGVDARTALFVGQARGAILVAAAEAGVECAEYAPSRVKQAVCGYGRAEKAQVQRMVAAILGLRDAPTPHHAADALAVAICHALASPLLAAEKLALLDGSGGRRSTTRASR
jgi:crossover junction endodeoxyribonuclease RuvC